jgi:hypothetical protein
MNRSGILRSISTTSSRTLLACALALGPVACTTAQPSSAEGANAEALAAYEVPRLPKEGVTATLVDFGGRVHLVGHAIESAPVVHPGARVKLKLYWRAVAPLDPAFRISTYLINGRRVETLEAGGPLRQHDRGPSAWTAGKLYLDEQELTIPADFDAREITIAVGVVRDPLPQAEEEEAPSGAAGAPGESEKVTHPPVRLPVLSGTSDERERAVIGHLKNDVSLKPAPRARRTPGEPRRAQPRAATSAR